MTVLPGRRAFALAWSAVIPPCRTWMQFPWRMSWGGGAMRNGDLVGGEWHVGEREIALDRHLNGGVARLGNGGGIRAAGVLSPFAQEAVLYAARAGCMCWGDFVDLGAP